MASISIRFDVEPLAGVAERIDRLIDSAQINLGAVDAVNAVVRRADASVRAAEVAGIKLTSTYVKSKTDLYLATRKPSAEVVTRGDLTIMGHYPLRTSEGQGAIRRAGPRVGRRSGGVAVEIRSGQPTFEPQWFTMRLRQGTASGDKVGVFVRTSAGSVKHIYAVSPYSLARFQNTAQAAAIEEDLSQTGLAEISKRIEGALE